MPILYQMMSTFDVSTGLRESVFTIRTAREDEISVFHTAPLYTFRGGTVSVAGCLGDPNSSFKTLYHLCDNYLPYLEYLRYFIPPIPPLKRSADPELRTIGTASYSPVDVAGSVGYYGIADSLTHGLFYLNQEGVPLVAEPYLLNIANNLDVPLSQMSATGTQTLAVLQNMQTDTEAIAADVSDIKTNLATLVSVVSQLSMLVGDISVKQDTTNTLLSNLNVGSGGSGIVESITALSSTITSLLTFQPPRKIRLDTGVFENELTLYQPMSLSEMVARGLFSSNPIKTQNSLTEVEYTFTPYLSAGAPLQAGYDPTSGRFFAQYLQPEYPIGVPADYEDVLSGNVSVYTNPRYDPYYQYRNGAHITSDTVSPNTLVYTISKTNPSQRSLTSAP